jgi:site-specific recombinase XerD
MTVHEQLGRDLHRTQQALGHVNISSTLHYLPVADVEIQQAIVAVTYPFGPAASAPRGTPRA